MMIFEKKNKLRAITVCQPWGSLIVAGIKGIENRKYKTNHRGPLAIHAGLSTAWIGAARRMMEENPMLKELMVSFEPFENLVRGAVAGVVNLQEIVRPNQTASPFAFGPWCWYLNNPRELVRPIPYRGRQGLFYLNEIVTEQLLEQLENGTMGGKKNPRHQEGVSYDDAVVLVLGEGRATASLLQRRLGIGYAKARMVIEKMEREKLVGPMPDKKPWVRPVLMALDDWEASKKAEPLNQGPADEPQEQQETATEKTGDRKSDEMIEKKDQEKIDLYYVLQSRLERMDDLTAKAGKKAAGAQSDYIAMCESQKALREKLEVLKEEVGPLETDAADREANPLFHQNGDKSEKYDCPQTIIDLFGFHPEEVKIDGELKVWHIVKEANETEQEAGIQPGDLQMILVPDPPSERQTFSSGRPNLRSVISDDQREHYYFSPLEVEAQEDENDYRVPGVEKRKENQ